MHLLLPAGDYCNSLSYGVAEDQIRKLQRVINASARIVYCAPKYCNINPLLRGLHQLPVKLRIDFKILLHTYVVNSVIIIVKRFWLFIQKGTLYVIAELAERSPITIQNSSNPSSRKNLDVRPYDRTTVRPFDHTRCHFQHARPTVPRALSYNQSSTQIQTQRSSE